MPRALADDASPRIPDAALVAEAAQLEVEAERLLASGSKKDAETKALGAIAIRERELGVDDPSLLRALRVVESLASERVFATRDWEDRLPLIALEERILALARASQTADALLEGRTLLTLAHAYQDIGDSVLAARSARDAYLAYERAPDSPDGQLYESLALAIAELSDFRDFGPNMTDRWACADLAERLQARRAAAFGPSSIPSAEALVLLACALLRKEGSELRVDAALARALEIAGAAGAAGADLKSRALLAAAEAAFETGDVLAFESNVRACGLVAIRDDGVVETPPGHRRVRGMWGCNRGKRAWLDRASDAEVLGAFLTAPGRVCPANFLSRRLRDALASSINLVSRGASEAQIQQFISVAINIRGTPTWDAESERLLRQIMALAAASGRASGLASATRNLAANLESQGRLPEAAEAYLAGELATARLGSQMGDSGEFDVLARLVIVYSRLGDLSRMRATIDRFVGAARRSHAFQEWLARGQTMDARGLELPWTPLWYVSFGALLLREGFHREAELLLLPVDAAVRKAMGPAPALMRRGEFIEAVREGRAALVVQDRADSTAGLEPSFRGALRRYDLAEALSAAGAHEEGRVECDEALRRMSSSGSLNQDMLRGRLAAAMGLEARVAESLLRRGNPEQARSYAVSALALGRAFRWFGGLTPGSGYTPDPAIGDIVAGRGSRFVAEGIPVTLARILDACGEPDRAIRTLEDDVQVVEKRTSPTALEVARPLVALAEIETELGRRDPARKHAARALGIVEKALGLTHPDVADAVLAIADLDLLVGHRAEARLGYERALEVLKDAVFEIHPSIARALAGQSLAMSRAGDTVGALVSMRRALRLVATRVGLSYGGASAGERIGIIASAHWALVNWLEVSAKAGVDGYAEALALKGYVGRAMAREENALRFAKTKDSSAVEKYREAKRRLARLIEEPLGRGEERVPWLRDVAEATASVGALRRAVPELREVANESLDRWSDAPSEIAKRLRPAEAVVDLLLAGGRYTAWILQREQPPVRLDLGLADEIEPLLVAFRDAVRDAPSTGDPAYLATGAAARKRCWQPIADVLGAGIKTVLWVPDGGFCASPIHALPAADGKGVLDDEIELVRLQAATDVLSTATGGAPGKGLVVVGAVDYDHDDKPKSGPAITDEEPLNLRVGGWPKFKALPATAREAEMVAKRFKEKASGAGITSLTGDHASESSLRRAVPGCRVLHLATHGYVREGLGQSIRLPERDEFRLKPGLERHVRSFDPMLLSGVALSGANARIHEDEDDGILTALEATELDLAGVELVTLSACDTARGIERAGDGVFGLVRGFMLAGARQVVATLWPVDDEGTYALMDRFYERFLAGGGSAAAALRDASRALRRGEAGPEFAAPRHWAAFVAHGRPK